MASIIGLEQQQEALNEINATIKAVAIINKFLEAENPSKTYSIRFTDEAGEKVATNFTASKDEVNKLLIQDKNEKRVYVTSLAQDYKIALSLADKQILGIDENAETM